MTANNLIKDWKEEEVTIALNRKESLSIGEEGRHELKNFMGAKVVLQNGGDFVRCEVTFPESRGILRWLYRREKNGRISSDNPFGAKAPNLAALIAESRLAIHGDI